MKEKAIIEFSVTPVGGGESMRNVVAKCTRRVRSSGIKNELHAMGTILEGDLDECLELVKSCIRDGLEEAPRVNTSIRVDVHPSKVETMRERVEAVEKIL